MKDTIDGYGSINHTAKTTTSSSTTTTARRRPVYTRRNSSFQIYKTFLTEFHAAKGGWLIVLLGSLSALGIGCLVGVIPQVATQLYAERIVGLGDVGFVCNSYAANDPLRPHACAMGADHAQAAASYSAAGKHCLALLTNSLAGSYADTHGRRDIQLACLFFMFFPIVIFVLIQIPFSTPIHPNWFFVSESLSGIVNFYSIGFTQLSDLMPPKHRAAAYGIYIGSFMGALAVAPFLATLMSHFAISILACGIKLLALLIAVFFLPETLPQATMSQAAKTKDSPTTTIHTNTNTNMSVFWTRVGKLFSRPFRELKILGRNRAITLVALGSFAAKAVFSADITLFFYYVERELGVTDQDVAKMMFLTGVLGLIVQAGLLQYLISMLGEGRLLVVSFLCGAFHNLVYGFATTKWVLYIGLCISPLTHTNSPLLSSLASRNVPATEQGRIQGSLYSLTSVAEALGPIGFNFLYRNWHVFGPGSMFVGGATVYFAGLLAVSMIPPKTSSREELDCDDDEVEDDDENDDDEKEDGDKELTTLI